MKGLLKKVRENKKGFTLAELLVVVAIVGILVAISIPVFTAQLGKARFATNQANLRAAKAAAVSSYLTDESKTSTAEEDGYYLYTVADGTVAAATKDEVTGTEIDALDSDDISRKEVYTDIYVTIEGAKEVAGDNGQTSNVADKIVFHASKK